MITLGNLNEVKAELEEIVRGRENYVYAVPADADDCVYFDPASKAPSCIVGHLIARHGVTYDDVTAVRYNCNIYTSVAGLRGEDIVDASDDVVDYLNRVQSAQDVRIPWGEAIQQ